MGSEIALNDIADFKKHYLSNDNNVSIEEKIKKYGLMQASVDCTKTYEFKFNIEVPEIDIYDQLDSHQCNVFAFLRVVKDILRINTDIVVDDLSLSSNYINFFDHLEKANALYNALITCEDLTLDRINQKVNNYIGSFGTFQFCREIVNKYGLVTSSYMAEVNENYDDFLTTELFRKKIKSDAVLLLKLEISEREKIKKELMCEVYSFLAKVYGNPPISFSFDDVEMTPLQFKELYLKNYLDEYVTVTSFTKTAFLSSYSFIPSIYLNNDEDLRHITTQKMQEVVVNQLKDGVSVWFSAEESTTLDYKENILDDKYYDFNKLLNIRNLSKNQNMYLDVINYDHAMCITGALVQDGEVKQYKVDNSFGKHGKYDGRLIMTTSFFENCINTVVVNKKYLS